MKTLICTSCGQAIRIGSTYCPNCGTVVAVENPSVQLNTGRQKLILIIIAILSASLIGRLFTLWIGILNRNIGLEFVVSGIVDISLTALLLYFLYHGYWWAKWVTVAILALALSILLSLMFTTFKSPIAPMFLLVLISQSLLYGISGLALLRSRDVASFLKEQRK